jgi:hypothetical protein
MMLRGLCYSRFGGKRIIQGRDLKKYLIAQTKVTDP